MLFAIVGQVFAMVLGAFFYATMPKPNFDTSRYKKSNILSQVKESSVYTLKAKAKSKDKKKIKMRLGLSYDKSNAALKKELKKSKKKMRKALKKLIKQKKKSEIKAESKFKLGLSFKTALNLKLKKGQLNRVTVYSLK